MQCQADILQLVEGKLKESDCLFNSRLYDGAYYLAGYAVELMLKARVCKTLGIDDFFNFKTIPKKELYKPYKVHNYEELLVLSGIYSEFVNAQNSIDFKAKWSIARNWSEESRYIIGKTMQDTKEFLTSIKTIVEWIRQFL